MSRVGAAVIYYEARTLFVGDQRWPVSEWDGHDSIGPVGQEVAYDFRTRRALVAFENGWALSIIWGSGTWSDNHDHPFGAPFVEQPETVEVAVMWYGRHGVVLHEPIEYVDADRLNGLLREMATWSSSVTGFLEGYA